MTPRLTPRPFLDPILFAHGPELVRTALAAGIASFIVDWEWRDKERRQRGADTEVNRDTVEDLRRLAGLGVPRRFCRLNRFGAWTSREVDDAVAAGATDLLLPMVEAPVEAESFLTLVAGRCRVGILVETVRGVEASAELAALPLDRVYVGLNDLAISRGSECLFEALADGTAEQVSRTFTGVPFGFGGLTVADGGRPVPCRLLMAEMVRLGCAFTFLRRSFRRDVAGRDMAHELARMRALWCELAGRSAAEVESDRSALAARVGRRRRRAGAS